MGDVRFSALVLLAVVSACGDDSTSSDPSSPAAPGTVPAADGGAGGGGGSSSLPNGGTLPTGLPCDVESVLKQNCQSCHGSPPTFGAPMPLVTLADLMAPAKSNPAKKNYELVAERIHDTKAPMPQRPNPPLSAADMQTIDQWVAAGAPGNTSGQSCGGGTGPTVPATKPLSCTPDTTLAPGSKFAMPQNKPDVYVCYGVDVPVKAKRHAIAITPKIDNTKILHHIVLMQTDKTASPTPAECSPGAIAQGRMMYAWAPGGQPLELPEVAGFPMEGTAHYMVQLHYNNAAGAAGQSDASGVEFCTTDKLRANDADVAAFGTVKINIPARSTVDLTCDYKVPQQLAGKTFFAAMPHMHGLGKSMVTELFPSGEGANPGAKVDMGSQPAWDFNNQDYFQIQAKPKAGDTIRSRCVYDNPGSSPVTFGENTSDEMCWSFTLYYPKVTQGLWQWALPSIQASCQSK